MFGQRIRTVVAAIALFLVPVAAAQNDKRPQLDNPPFDPCNPPKDKSLSDPIDLGLGDFVHKQIDLTIPGRGMDFTFKRTYRSRTGFWSFWGGPELIDYLYSGGPVPVRPMSPMGTNWDHNFNQWAEVDLSGQLDYVHYYRGDGLRASFAAEDTINGVIIFHAFEFYGKFYYGDRDAGGSDYGPESLEYVTADNMSYRFIDLDDPVVAKRGKLATITDRNSNVITLSYDTTGRLVTVTDTLGRTVTFEYLHPTKPNLLTAVIDFAGRRVEYGYTIIESNANQDYEKHNLTTVTLPAVTASDPNFPLPTEHLQAADTAPRIWQYTYAPEPSTWASPPQFAESIFWAGGLEEIRDPRNELVVKNIYTEPNPLRGWTSFSALDTTRDDYRVAAQQHGDGWYNYHLEILGGGDPDTNEDPYAVWVNNREGQVIRLEYTANRRLKSRTDYSAFAADPASATTGLTAPENGPTVVVRAGEPASYVTKYFSMDGQTETIGYNDDWLTTYEERPSGYFYTNEYEDVGGDEDQVRAGNLKKRTVHAPGDVWRISEEWTYNFVFGTGCCGSSFPTAYTDGRGNTTTMDYYTATGNLKWIVYPTITQGVLGGASYTPREDFTYNGFGQITLHQHPEGPSGARRIDLLEYYGASDGYQNGYLKSIAVDSTGTIPLVTSFEYDLVGNVVEVTDPNDNRRVYTYNQLNEVVRVSHYDAADALMSQVDYFYDAAGYVVRQDVLNIDADGAVVGETADVSTSAFTILIEYDALGFATDTFKEAEPVNVPLTQRASVGLAFADRFVHTEYAYTDNNKISEIKYGEATNGSQTDNRTTFEYDGRDLLFKRTRAPGHADETITQYDYNAEQSLQFSRIALGPDVRVYERVYDPINRLKQIIDPLENSATLLYDNNHNVFRVVLDGEVEPGQGIYATLAQTDIKYDRLNRPYEYSREWFSVASNGTPTDISSGTIARKRFYAANSLTKADWDEAGNSTSYLYDSADRLIGKIDAAGNACSYLLDNNGNVEEFRTFELSGIGGPTLQFLQAATYDGLNRPTSSLDGVGNQRLRGYDSRGNAVRDVDAFGRESAMAYDGLSRLIETVHDMNGSGASAADPVDILITQVWDDSSRVIGKSDDNGNLTSYAFDPVDRIKRVTYADGSAEIIGYNAASNPTSFTDCNGTVVTQSFDLLDRLTDRTVVPAAGVGGALYSVCTETPFEHFKYDGLSRLVWAEDNDSLVERQFDSLGRLMTESVKVDPNAARLASCPTRNWAAIAANVVSYGFDEVGNTTDMQYASGRSIHWSFDELNRVDEITDVTNAPADLPIVTSIAYAGPDRFEQMVLGNGAKTTWQYGGFEGGPAPQLPDFDYGFRKVRQITHAFDATPGPDVTFDDRTVAWDENQNKKQRTDQFNQGARTHVYGYDTIDRLISTDVTGSMAQSISYQLDGVGNRESVSGASVSGDYFMASYDEPVSQYSVVPTASDNTLPSYDPNGNLETLDQCPGDTDGNQAVDLDDLQRVLFEFGNPPSDWRIDLDGSGTVDLADLQIVLFNFGNTCGNTVISYDFANRMIEHAVYDYQATTPSVRHTYAYDAIGRRIKKVVDLGGLDEHSTIFVWGGRFRWQLLEELDASGNELRSYVHMGSSGYIDHVVSMRNHTVPGGASVDFWYHSDDLFNTMVVTDASQAVRERYEYDDYGAPIILDPVDNQTVRTFSEMSNPFMFTGQYYDAETNLYYYRTRYLEPQWGRFTSRDVLGVWGSTLNMGSPLTYVASAPMCYVDPWGMDAWVTSWFGGALDGTMVGSAIDYTTDAVVDGGGAMIGLDGGAAAGAAWGGFAEGYSEATYGTVGALTGGFIDSDYGFLGYKDEVLDAVDLEDSEAYEIGTWGGRSFTAITTVVGALRALGRGGGTSKGTLHVKPRIHPPEKGGPHQFWHFQLNWWRQGIKGKPNGWHIPLDPRLWKWNPCDWL